MNDVTEVSAGALAESIAFLGYFTDLPDPRQQSKVAYALDEILLLALLATLAGAETFVEIALFGVKKRELLRRFRPFAAGTPSHDHLGDLFARLDSEKFQSCFVAWVASFIGLATEVVAIDGKTSRRTHAKKNGQAALHTVSAFAAGQRLALGQVRVSEKSNEITAIPKLLALLDLEGAIVTLDAMGCQRDIAAQIVQQKADYVLALKGNQTALHEDVKLFVETAQSQDFSGQSISRHADVHADHGRIETRTTTVLHDVDWLQKRHHWPGLAALIVVHSQREANSQVTAETRLYLTSLTLPADRLGSIVRDHWSVENSLHWVLDMLFRDDESRVRTEHAPANLTTLKHMAINLLRRPANRHSLRARRKIAGWDDDFLASLIARPT